MMGGMKLENLELKDDILLNQSIPIVIREGKIGRLNIDVPLVFTSNPIKIEIENIELRARLLVEHRIYEDKKKKINKTEEEILQSKSIINESFKTRRLKEWENKLRKKFQDIELTPPSWMEKSLQGILKNVSINVKNVTIFYESHTILNVASVMKINFEEISIYSTNQNWEPTFNSSPEEHFKEIQIKGFSVSLNIASKSDPTDVETDTRKSIYSTHFDSKNPKFQKPAKYFSEDADLIEADYKRLRKDNSFLIFPIDVVLRGRTESDTSTDFNSESLKGLWIEIRNPLIFVLNNKSLKFLSSLPGHTDLIKIVQKNIHLRPIEPPKEKPRGWWIYSIKAVMEERKRLSTIIKNSTKNLLNMKKYVDLYKRKQTIIHVPWLQRISGEEEDLFNKLEDEISLLHLLEYRERAFIELRQEAQRYFESNKSAKQDQVLEKWLSKSSESNATKSNQSEILNMINSKKGLTLKSLFKKINSDPNETDIVIDLAIRSTYFLFTRPSMAFTSILEDSRKIYLKDNAKISDWWLKPSQINNKNINHLDQSLRSIDEDLRKGRDLAEFFGSPEITKEKKETEKQEIDESDFFSAKENDYSRQFENNMEYFEDSDIHIANESQYTIEMTKEEPERLLSEENKAQHLIQKQIQEINARKKILSWWNQKIVLIFEFLGISSTIQKLQSGKVISSSPLSIKTIMISTAYNLKKAIEERDKNLKNFQFCHLEYKNLIEKILHCEFDERYVINGVPKSIAHPLYKYLLDNDHENIAFFLRKYTQDLTKKNIDIKLEDYKQFFDSSNQNYIPFGEKAAKHFNTMIGSQGYQKDNISKFLKICYNVVVNHLDSKITGQFIHHSGLLIIPLIFRLEVLQFQSSIQAKDSEGLQYVDKLEKFPLKLLSINYQELNNSRKDEKQTSLKSKNDAMFTFNFSLEKKNIMDESNPVMRDDLNPDLSSADDSSLHNDFEIASEMNFSLSNLGIYLSTDSIEGIARVMDGLAGSKMPKLPNMQPSEIEENLSYQEYENIMSCINNIVLEQPEANVQVPKIQGEIGGIKITLTNYSSHFNQNRTVEMTLDKIFIQSRKSETLQKDDEFTTAEIKRLTTKYKLNYIKISKLEINESVYTDQIPKSNTLLSTKVIICDYESFEKHHPARADQKVHILIPYFNFHIDDNFVLLSNSINILNSMPRFEFDDEIEKTHPLDQRAFIAMGLTQHKTLMSKLSELKKNHDSRKSNCKHCLLRFKKSTKISNIFIGNLADYFEGVDLTTFANLYNDPGDLETNENESGLKITISCSIGQKTPDLRTIFNLPFISITRDEGFFKDNIVIHSTQGFPYGIGETLTNKECFIKSFKPCIVASKDLIYYLDDVFYKYFKQLEKKYIYHSEEKSDDRTFSQNRKTGDSDFSDQEIYILMIQKKVLKTNFLKKFEVKNDDEKIFKNCLIFKLKEIDIGFNDFNSFEILGRTLTNLKNVDNWFKHYLKWLHEFEDHDKASSSQNENLWTYNDLSNSLNKDYLSIVLDKINLSIVINSPENQALFHITNLCFDNFAKTNSHMHHSGSNDGPLNLFSMDSVLFSTGKSGKAEIKNSKLYFSQARTLTFSIEDIAISAANHTLLQIPDQKPNKSLALKIDIGFDKDCLSRMLINVFPIKIYISTLDVIDQLNSISTYRKAFEFEKALLIKNSIINEQIFIQIGDVSKLDKQPKYYKKTAQSTLKIGPFAAGLSTFLKLNLETINITCAKEDQIFSEIEISNAEFERDSKELYTGNIEMIKLNPQKGVYKDLFSSVDATSQQMYIKIEKSDDCPLVTIGNARITYLDSAIRDLVDFKKEIQSKIKSHSKENTELTEKLPYEMESIHSLHNEEEAKKKMVSLKILNSVIIVPENRDSSNVFEAQSKEINVQVGQSYEDVYAPVELKHPFDIVQGDLIIRKEESREKVRGLFIVADVDIKNARASYTKNGVRSTLGKLESLSILALSPDLPIMNENWKYDALIQIQADDIFSLLTNTGATLEIKTIIKENLKEVGIFGTKPKMYERTQLSVKGKTTNITMNRSIIKLEDIKNYVKNAGDIKLK